LEAQAPKQTAEILRPYIPRLTIRWLAEEPEANYKVVEGSMVFVDISGFTKMSERLARHGKVGAEEVTDVLGAVFTKLLAVAYGEDGSLLKFGGDALLLWFVGEGHAIRAATAAHGMRATLRSIGKLDTTAGKVLLRMSVGVNSGDFNFFLVGESHRELIVTGPAATRTVDMESTATAGEILVSRDTAEALPDGILGQPKGEGLLLKRGPSTLSFVRDQVEVPIASVDVAGCIPFALREHLLSGFTDPEHRTATVAFVHFDGVDGLTNERGPGFVANGLNELVSVAQRASEQNGVTFLGTDIDHDGGKIILVAGAPLAREDDEGRMLLTVRSILEAGTEIPVRIGVNKGPVFAGDIGPTYRRTYTVMGDAVNLAARVMSMAIAGQILSTGPVLDASSVAFNALALQPFMVKGKKDPVHAFMVGHSTGSKTQVDTRDLPLVGRDDEMEAFRRALLELRGGKGSVLELVANPGMGKTRLLTEFRAEAPDLPELVTNCELYESSVSYLPFRRLLRLLLGQSGPPDPSTVAARLEEDVRARAPHLLPWLPLLGVVADAEVPDTLAVRDLGEEFRKAKLEEVMTEYLSCVVSAPTLIVIEDAHWMDEGSAHLLHSLAKQIGGLPWLVCVSRRDEETGFVAPDAERNISLLLEPLSESSLGTLIELATEDAPLPQHAVSELSDRSGGNPLFLQELVHAARTANSIEGLPDSIEGMVTAEIDRLAIADRRVIRYASVLGVTFESALLRSLWEGQESAFDASAWQRLGQFVIDEGDGRYRFRHALMRDAAYEGLPYRRRRELHARAGEAVLSATLGDGSERAELLSMHFFLAGDMDRAWTYSKIAAERAEESYANVEASRFYRRAIESSRRLEIEQTELIQLYERLGDVLERASLYPEAARAYGEARRRHSDDPVSDCRLILKQAKLADKAGKPSSSLRLLTQALRSLDGTSTARAAELKARLSATYSVVRAGQGKAVDAIRWAERAIVEAETVGEQEALANAHYMIAWTNVNRGHLGQGAHFEQALSIFEDLGDLVRQGDVLNYWGAMAYWEGRWSDAVELYERGGDRSRRAGDVVGPAIALMNIAEIRSDQGRLDEAEGPAREALRVFRAAEYPELIATDSGILGRILSRAGRHEEAVSFLTEALRVAEVSGGQLMAVGVTGFLAEDRVRQGDAATAFDELEGAESRAEAVGGPGVHEPLIERVRGCAHLLLGNFDEAGDALAKSLRAARSAGAEFEVLLALHAVRALSEARNAEPSTIEEADASSIAERLGVVYVPSMLPVAAT